MDKDFTQLSIAEFAAVVKKAMCADKPMEPKESSLQYLKTLARNLRVEKKLPEDLQGYILS